MAYASTAASLPTQRHSRPSILRDIVVERGPTEILGAFFLHTEVETRKRGVALEFCDPEDLVTANEANRKSWLPLVPMFNPRYGIINRDNSFSMLGRNSYGE